MRTKAEIVQIVRIEIQTALNLLKSGSLAKDQIKAKTDCVRFRIIELDYNANPVDTLLSYKISRIKVWAQRELDRLSSGPDAIDPNQTRPSDAENGF